MIEDLADRYHEYLERWKREAGEVPVGSFAKVGGKLIKKLSFEEMSRYEESVERGDTINDVVLKVLRDQAAKLLLTPPTADIKSTPK